MGKGGYNGGSTIVGPWSGGWFSRPRGKPVQLTPEEMKAAAERRAEIKAQNRATMAAKQNAREGKAAGKRVTKISAERKRRELAAMPRSKKTPEEIAERLGQAMKGVEVRRITGRTLRLRKPKSG
jgi:hypothetical protein